MPFTRFVFPALLGLLLTASSLAQDMASSLHVEAPTLELGDIWRGQDLQGTFTLTNTGDSPIGIYDVSTECVCTVPALKQGKIAPGKGLELPVAVDTWQVNEASGRIVREVHVTFEDDSVVTLYLAFNMKDRHQTNPGVKRDHVYRRGSEDPWAAWQILPHGGAKIVDVEVPEALSGEVYEEAGVQWVKVSPSKQLGTGGYRFVVRVHLDDDVVPMIPFELNWLLVPDTQVQPRFLAFMALGKVRPKVGIRNPKSSYKDRITIHRKSGKELEIKKITVSNEALIKVKPRPADEARSRWVLEVTVFDRFPANEPVQEWVEVETNDPDLPKFRIPVWNSEGMNRAKSARQGRGGSPQEKIRGK